MLREQYISFHKEHKALYFCIFVLFLLSMNLWIGWEERYKYIYVGIGLLMLALVVIDNIKLNFSRKNIISLLVVLFSYSYINTPQIGSVFTFYIPTSLIILLNEKDRIRCFRFIYKWFSLLMIPSILTYIFVQTVGLPSLGKIWFNHVSFFDTSYILRDNYLFYEHSSFYGIRFNGPFLEPGHLGMMITFMLLADGFDLKKKETLFLLISLILTLSLAGFVLLFLAFFCVKISQNMISKKIIGSCVIIVIAIYLFGVLYNGGDNFINEYFLSRLQYDDEKGFSGNNRVWGQIDAYFAAMFLNTDLLLYGYSRETIEWLAYNGSRGAGFEMWMVAHGLIGTIIAMLFYTIYTLFTENRKISIIFLFFVVVIFWQRSYPFWFSWIICFVYGITNNSQLYKQSKNENRNTYISSQS